MPGRLRLGSTTTVHPSVRHQSWTDKCAIGAKITITVPKEGSNYSNTECPLSTCQRKKVQELTHRVKMPSMGHFGPCRGQMDRSWGNTTDEGHKILYCGKGLKTSGWGGIHCTERSCKKYHQLHSRLQQTLLHPHLSENTQHHSHPGLYTILRP